MTSSAPSTPAIGRASPVDHSDDPDFAAVACPHCGHRPCSVLSLFGGGASEVLFQCTGCRSCFHWIKWQGKLPFDPAS